MIGFDPLSGQARHWLRTKDAKQQPEGVWVKTKVKSAQEVLRWCIALDLIASNSLNLPEFLLTKDLLDTIAQKQIELKQLCFRQTLKTSSRTEQAQFSDQEDKQQGIKPRENRILVRLHQQQEIALGTSVEVVDIEWQQLDFSRFSRLIVVENLDCFYELESFQKEGLLAGLSSTDLVIYRGDSLYTQGSTALKKAWLSSSHYDDIDDYSIKPIIYFGDFDPKGVSIALFEGYQGIALPSLSTLSIHASPGMSPEKQQDFLPRIEALAASKNNTLTPELGAYLKILLQHKGLRQQRMRGMVIENIQTRTRL
ncbi:DUF7281 domain-containing protein [Oceanospirillum maris]|uniref:DUF7281 domain-containing protein n=1 Tax=Oceanospirillum maris TaxID=64977 RepID=UPI000423BE4B|nr:hypothetical protein [Oceanospirillum maris]